MITFQGQRIPFGQCIVELMKSKDVGSFATIIEKNNSEFELVASPDSMPVMHAPHCPCLYHDLVSDDTRDVALAACVVVFVRGHGVLLTRRSETLRTFPGVYVLPGGHKDAGETLEMCARRELFEECGIRPQAPFKPVAVYESVFPVEHRLVPKVRMLGNHLCLFVDLVGFLFCRFYFCNLNACSR